MQEMTKFQENKSFFLQTTKQLVILVVFSLSAFYLLTEFLLVNSLVSLVVCAIPLVVFVAVLTRKTVQYLRHGEHSGIGLVKSEKPATPEEIEQLRLEAEKAELEARIARAKAEQKQNKRFKLLPGKIFEPIEPESHDGLRSAIGDNDKDYSALTG
jgi:competence protein ComGC